jgi:hypothetical protein
MRSCLRAAASVAVCLAVAQHVSAQTYTVTAVDVYVRAAPGGFMIGTLYNGDHFRKQQSNSGYYWGRAGGTAQICGWVDAGSLTPGGTVNTTCGGSGSTATGQAARDFLLANWARRVNDYIPGVFYVGGDSGSRTHIVSGLSAHLYGNYDGVSFHHQITTTALTSSANLDWRWISDSDEAVVVKLENGPWAFMRRDKLPTNLPYKDGNSRPD